MCVARTSKASSTVICTYATSSGKLTLRPCTRAPNGTFDATPRLAQFIVHTDFEPIAVTGDFDSASSTSDLCGTVKIW